MKRKSELMPVQEYRDLSKKSPAKKNKFGRKIVKNEEGTFHSVWEYRRFGELKMLQRIGDISNLRRQIPYVLTVNGVEITKYIADFVYLDKHSKEVVEDTKSEATEKMESFRMKKALMKALFGIDILVTLDPNAYRYAKPKRGKRG